MCGAVSRCRSGCSGTGPSPAAADAAPSATRGVGRTAPRASRSCRGRRRRAAWTTSTGRAPAPTRYGSARRPWPEDELADVLDAAVDVAADVVRVVRLHRGRVRASPGRGSGRGSPGANRSTWASMRSVMSTSEPAGTWQYAQAVVLPAGARVGSHGAYWTNRTNGRSGWRPAATSASAAAISSSVPPRWTVAARRGPSAVHGIGPSSAQSTLKTPEP